MPKLTPPPRKDEPRFDDWIRVELYERLKALDAAPASAPSLLSASQAASLTRGNDSTLHYHASDRQRANHTGTQPASTISDFEEAVRAAMGGGIQDHALLLNNAWTSSAHTGTPSRFAAFDGSGIAVHWSVGTSLELSGTTLQRSALTGDVTAAAGSNSTTIANNAVSNAKIRDSGACSVIGRSANSSGDPADISAGSNDTLLRRVSDAVGFGQLTVGMFPNDVVTYAKIQNVSATDRLLGRSSSGAGDIEEITCTPFARSLLDDASASAARATLEIDTDDSVTFGAVTGSSFIPTGSTVPANGMYLSAANVVAFSTGSTQRVRIGASGLRVVGVPIICHPVNVGASEGGEIQILRASDEALAGLLDSQGDNFRFLNLVGGVIYFGPSDVSKRMVIDSNGLVTAHTLEIANTLDVTDAVTGASFEDAKGEVRTIVQNSQSAAYTLVLSDAGKHILHPSADTTARIWTIPANSSVAFPVGTAVTFVNQSGAGTITIAITTDTLRLAGSGATGSRTLAANGIATAMKVTSTEWIISGINLT